MNNLLETKWYENPVVLGAIAGSGKFYLVPQLYKGDKYQLNHDILDDGGVYNSDRFQQSIPIQECTLIARSIESLTDEEKQKAFKALHQGIVISKQTIADSYAEYEKKGELKILLENKAKRFLPLFIYLLSIGIWTGSKEGVEVVE